MNEQEQRIISIAEDKGIIIRDSLVQARSGGKTLRHGFAMGVNFTLNNLWISVEEDLPEISTETMRSNKMLVRSQGRYYETFYTAVYDKFSEEWTDGDYVITNVTHWMPIPSVKEGETK